jgi:hypothetical protein
MCFVYLFLISTVAPPVPFFFFFLIPGILDLVQVLAPTTHNNTHQDIGIGSEVSSN